MSLFDVNMYTIVTIAYHTSCYNKIEYFKFIVIFYTGLTTCVILIQHSLAATFFGRKVFHKHIGSILLTSIVCIVNKEISRRK